MHPINIDNDKLKSIARTLLSELVKRDAMLSGKKPNYNMCLQMASMGIFNKPYEEVKAMTDSAAHTGSNIALLDTTAFTSVANLTKEDNNGIPRVRMFHDGNEYFITLDGKFFSAQFKDSVHEVNDEEIFEIAQAAANVAKSILPPVIHLPVILADNARHDKSFDLAEKIGYFKYKRTLLDLIDDPDTKVFINGHYIQYKLNGDYAGEMEEADEPLDHCVWIPEWQDGHNHHEMFISFNELCSATPLNDSLATWELNYQGHAFNIEVH